MTCTTVEFFSGRTVLSTAFAETNSEKKEIRELANSLACRILDNWKEVGNNSQQHHAETATDIAPDLLTPELLGKVFNTVFHRPYWGGPPKNTSDTLVYMLCQAASTGVAHRAKGILNFMEQHARNSPSHSRPLANEKGLKGWLNECGVERDRMLTVPNPFRIAAAKGSVFVLEALFQGWDALDLYLPDYCSSEPKTLDEWSRLVHGKPNCHPVRRAVYDVFIEPTRLPGNKIRKYPDVKVLETILKHSSVKCWHADFVGLAGMCPEPEYLEAFLGKLDLHEEFADRTAIDLKWPRDEYDVFDNPSLKTVGQRALQYALRPTHRKEPLYKNVKFLLQHGVMLAENLRLPVEIFVDEVKDMQIKDDLCEAAGESLVVATRERQELYVLGEGQLDSVEKLKGIYATDVAYSWKLGSRKRRI